ncbi:hypothetical protein ACHQM5_029970 [Ranunculus cassubicifolius]
MDIPLSGGSYTWSNHQDDPILPKLDNFLVNVEWEYKWPYLSQYVVSGSSSNHRPARLDCERISRSPTSFRFEFMWFEKDLY